MKKIGLIALIVVLSLGIIGVGYAAWNQTFNVTGTVSAGSYIVSIQQTPAATMGNDTSGGLTFTASGTLLTTSATTVNVSDSTSTVLVTIGPLTTTGTSAGFSITIAKGYPGLILDVPYKITNTGSVPSLISAVKIGIKGQSMNTWLGGLTNISYGTATDVTVQNTSDGSTTLDLTNKALAVTSGSQSGILVVTIPDALTGQTDAGGLNNVTPAQTFNFEIDTVQNP
jgi:hypothetical protein